MAGRIERMNRMRRNILLIVFIGSCAAFGMFLFPSFYNLLHFQERPRFFNTLFLAALLLWLIALAFFTVRYLLYKNILRKEPTLRQAVNDERVKLNWLRSYRFAFFAVIFFQGLLLLVQLTEALLGPLYLLLPNLYLTIFLAFLSLVGAFLHYNREANDG